MNQLFKKARLAQIQTRVFLVCACLLLTSCVAGLTYLGQIIPSFQEPLAGIIAAFAILGIIVISVLNHKLQARADRLTKKAGNPVPPIYGGHLKRISKDRNHA